MTLQTTKTPYEFLARWDADGKLQGCHVQWRYIISDGTVTVAESVSEAEAVTSATVYPLADLLDQMQASAVAAAGDANAGLTAAVAQIGDLEQRLAEQTSHADTLAGRLAALQQLSAVADGGLTG